MTGKMDNVLELINKASELTSGLIFTTQNKQKTFALGEQERNIETIKTKQTEKNMENAVKQTGNEASGISL